MAVVDAHVHVPRLSTVTSAWMQWADDFGKDSAWRDAFGPDGDPVPGRLDALLAAEGVDVALLFAEYSPRATGIQPVEDLLPLIAYNPRRFRLVANVNPAVHAPLAAEAARQLDLGAVAVKLHPVHGAFRPDAEGLYPVYDLCAEREVPVIVHTGGSIFPGSQPETGDPKLMSQVVADFPGVKFVLAHGGRGAWYADAARMALACDNVLARPSRAAAEAAAGLLRRLRPDRTGQEVDLRDRLARCAWRGQERARRSRPRPPRRRPGRRAQRQRGPTLPAGLVDCRPRRLRALADCVP